MHCDWAMLHQPAAGKRVLVVGCNTGLDCKTFVDAGAKSVHGLDIDEQIGRDYQNSRVKYFRASAEKMPFRDATYDLVFSFATMEHVPDVAAAFREMGRVTKPGGLIYCLASPLWNSRYGHHFPQYFADVPWIHLRADQQAVEDYLVTNDVQIAVENIDAPYVAKYMFTPEYFNRTASTEYLRACEQLTDFEPLRNALDLEPAESIAPDVLADLETRGYTRDELLAVTHTFIARKRNDAAPRGPFAFLRRAAG